ncbi:hypothetical protein ACWGM8_31590, partial [Streptomyces albidoflavus]
CLEKETAIDFFGLSWIRPIGDVRECNGIAKAGRESFIWWINKKAIDQNRNDPSMNRLNRTVESPAHGVVPHQ